MSRSYRKNGAGGMNPKTGKFFKKISKKKFRLREKNTTEEELPVRSREVYDPWFNADKFPADLFTDDTWEKLRRK